MRCKQAQLLATTAVLLLACHRANAFGSALDDITKSFQSKCSVLDFTKACAASISKAASIANHAFDHGHETVDDLTAFCETACASWMKANEHDCSGNALMKGPASVVVTAVKQCGKCRLDKLASACDSSFKDQSQEVAFVRMVAQLAALPIIMGAQVKQARKRACNDELGSSVCQSLAASHGCSWLGVGGKPLWQSCHMTCPSCPASPARRPSPDVDAQKNMLAGQFLKQYGIELCSPRGKCMGYFRGHKCNGNIAGLALLKDGDVGKAARDVQNMSAISRDMCNRALGGQGSCTAAGLLGSCGSDSMLLTSTRNKPWGEAALSRTCNPSGSCFRYLTSHRFCKDSPLTDGMDLYTMCTGAAQGHCSYEGIVQRCVQGQSKSRFEPIKASNKTCSACLHYLNSKHCRAPESLKYIVAGVPLHAMLPGLQTTTHFNLSSASTVMKALRNASMHVTSSTITFINSLYLICDAFTNSGSSFNSCTPSALAKACSGSTAYTQASFVNTTTCKDACSQKIIACGGAIASPKSAAPSGLKAAVHAIVLKCRSGCADARVGPLAGLPCKQLKQFCTQPVFKAKMAESCPVTCNARACGAAAPSGHK